MRNYILIIFIIPYIAVCAIQVYANSDVEIVMNGKLPYDKSISIGDAFNNFRYFESKKWKAHHDRSNERLVIFIGTLELGKLKRYNREINILRAAFIRVIFVIDIDNSIDVKSFSYQILLPNEYKLLDWFMDTPDSLKYSVLNIYKNDYKSGLIISRELTEHLISR